MEVPGVVLRPISGFSATGIHQSSKNPVYSCVSGAGKLFLGGEKHFSLDSCSTNGKKILVQSSCKSGFSGFTSFEKFIMSNFPSVSGFSDAGKSMIYVSGKVSSPESCRVSGFVDDSHLQYYLTARSGSRIKSEKQRRKDFPAMSTKKKLKLIKGLSKDLAMFSGMSIGDGKRLIDEVKSRMITEASEVLLAQLQQLKAEEKEMKRRKKEEKTARSKARAAARGNASTSSSSSESSDSECEVVDMSRLRIIRTESKPDLQITTMGTKPEPDPDICDPSHQVQVIKAEDAKLKSIIDLNQSSQEQGTRKRIQGIEDCSSFVNCGGDCNSSRSCCSSSNRSAAAVGASAERIEVCMGGKCKRSGAAGLLEEFERRVGIEGAVVGCKCMGKCRDGPNVRVLGKQEVVSAKHANPLCIGVALDDVGTIVAKFFGEKGLDLQLA